MQQRRIHVTNNGRFRQVRLANDSHVQPGSWWGTMWLMQDGGWAMGSNEYLDDNLLRFTCSEDELLELIQQNIPQEGGIEVRWDDTDAVMFVEPRGSP